MPCKVQNLRHKEACGENEPNTRRSRCACIVEAHESTRKRLEKTQQKGHEDRIVEKGFNSLSHFSLVQKFIRMPQAMKIPDAEGTVDKDWETLQKWPAWQLNKIKSRSGGHSGSRKEQRTDHFSMLMDICHLKNADLEPKCQKYIKRQSCAPWGHCNRRLWSLRCIYRAKKVRQQHK